MRCKLARPNFGSPGTKTDLFRGEPFLIVDQEILPLPLAFANLVNTKAWGRNIPWSANRQREVANAVKRDVTFPELAVKVGPTSQLWRAWLDEYSQNNIVR